MEDEVYLRGQIELENPEAPSVIFKTTGEDPLALPQQR